MFTPPTNLSHEAISQLTWDCQRTPWATLAWKNVGKQSPIFNEYMPQGMQAVVNLVFESTRLGFCPRGALANSLGHILTNAPQEWFDPSGPNVLEELDKYLGNCLRESGVHLDIIALCSGHGPNTNNVLKGIKQLARRFVNGKDAALPDKFKTPQLDVVLHLYSVHDVQSLYAAVVDSGLTRVQTTDAFNGTMASFALPDL